jgi:hypothetical protein
MPERKSYSKGSVWPAQYVAAAFLPEQRAKKDPGKPGSLGQENDPLQRLSEAKIRQITVADRDLGAGHQQPIDGRHQAAE